MQRTRTGSHTEVSGSPCFGSLGASWQGRVRRGLCAMLAAVLPGLMAPATASAQTGPRAPESLNGDGADTHLFRPAVDSKGFFSVNGTRILPANGISFGLVLDYGRSLLRVPDERKSSAEGVPCTADPNCVGVRALVPNSF